MSEDSDDTPTDDSKRATPPWAELLVRFLDDGIALPGTRYRIGFDGIIGLLLPALGDASTAAAALSLLWLAVRRGVPSAVLARMAFNVALDAFIGSIPIVGDVFDFVFKANRRNLRLIEQARLHPERRTTLVDWVVVVAFVLFVASAVALPLFITGVLLAKLLQ